jgi:hypothetical protein
MNTNEVLYKLSFVSIFFRTSHVYYFPPFRLLVTNFFTVANLTIYFFLLKNLRYFKAYNTNEVCLTRNHICENLMYLKFFTEENVWSTLLQ